ncbi:membrane protein [Gordonia phage Ekhein]|nr:membrane protein [Gordonia phage Ekhein]
MTQYRLIYMPHDLDDPNDPTVIIATGTYRALVRVAYYRGLHRHVSHRHTSDSDYRTWELVLGGAYVFAAVPQAVVHLSNYPAMEQGIIDEDALDHTCSPPMSTDDAGVMLEKAYVAMQAHPDATVTDYNNRNDYGSGMDYTDHEGVPWHMWIDTPDTAPIDD